VHLVGFTIEIYYDALSYERQICTCNNLVGLQIKGLSSLVFNSLNYRTIYILICRYEWHYTVGLFIDIITSFWQPEFSDWYYM